MIKAMPIHAIKSVRGGAKRMVRLAKNEEWRKFAESLENNANRNHKAFWAKLRKQRRGKDDGCKSVLSKSGHLS